MASSATSTIQTTSGDDAKQGPQAPPQGQAARIYSALKPKRQPYLDRARRIAQLTIPSLYPEEGATGSTDEQLPWNSIGAWLVNNLAAKVVLAMFPAGRPPMKLKQDRATTLDLLKLQQTEPQKASDMGLEIDAGLSKVEKEFSEAMEEDGDRAKINVAVRKKIVGGNYGLQFYPGGSLRGLRLEQYVTRRAPDGTLIEFVVEDPLAWETLPDDIRDICRRHGYQEDTTKPIQPTICVYTHGLRRNAQWVIYQEVYSEKVPESEARFNDEALPFLFLVWNLLEKEDYGRGYCEDYEADLTTVDGLEQTISEGSAAAARFIQMVNPTGLTSKKTVAEAANGSVISGRKDDVGTLQSEKAMDFQIAGNQQDKLAQRLGRAFLVTSAVMRDAERVTAKEVYEVSMELEQQLGGVYSQQVITFQMPYVTKKMRYLQQTNRVTPLPGGSVKMTIVGGMAALGRNAELAALDSLFAGAEQLFGPEAILQAIGPAGIRTYFAKRGAALGVDLAGLLPTPEQAAQLDAQRQAQAMAQQMGPEAIRQYGANQTANQVADTNAESKLAVAQAKQPTAPGPQTQQ